MKLANLLSQLNELETALQSFSVEELSISEASRLKSSFEDFKTRFEDNFWGQRPGNQKYSPTDTESESSRVIATVSHELRTPLNGIIGFADLLKETELTTEQERQVNAIHAASRSLLEIINELLEYSKLKAGLDNFETVNFKFRSVIEEVSYLCKTLIVDRDVRFKLVMDPDVPEQLVGDPAKLSQLLLNVLGNSVKFVEEGHILLEIALVDRTEYDVRIRMTVSDTGVGISKEDLSHIFESFKQAKQLNFSKYGGTGLGLSIVRQIVERLNGTVVLSSEIGQGTTITMEIPYKIGSPKVIAISREPLSAEGVKGMKILIFEDDQINQWVLEKRLNSWGCTHYVTANASYGLKILEDKDIDLVLMDLHLPGTDGFEITDIIRNNPDEKVNTVPVIAISADIRIADEIRCQEHGIDDFILKPYAPEELLMKMISIAKLKKSGDSAVQPVKDCISAGSESDVAIDLQPLLSECLGQVDLVEELAGLYKKNVLEFIGQVKLGLENEDLKTIEFATHKIKTGLRIIPTPALLGIAETLHTMSRNVADFATMWSLYEAFIAHYPKVENQLNDAIELIKK